MIPLAVPNLSGNEKKYLDDCIDTTFVSSVGAYVNRFEEEIAKEAGAVAATATASGTTALHIALLSAGVKQDELVIMPTFTFIATANAVSHCGAVPWLFDVEPVTWTLDAEAVARALAEETVARDGNVFHKKSGKRVAAILPVYTLGAAADMDMFAELSKKYRIPVVADAAAALRAEYKGKKLAELADLTIFSFNGNKTITSGGGGMIVSNDAERIAYAKHISTTARVSLEYDHDQIGYNYRMTNIQAAVGCAQLERLEQFVERKREIRKYYNLAFQDMQGIESFKDSIWGNSACWFSGIVIKDEAHLSVPEICIKMRNAGVEARSFWKPIHLQKPYSHAMMDSDFSVICAVWDKILTLPCSTGITEEELKTVTDTVKTILK